MYIVIRYWRSHCDKSVWRLQRPFTLLHGNLVPWIVILINSLLTEMTAWSMPRPRFGLATADPRLWRGAWPILRFSRQPQVWKVRYWELWVGPGKEGKNRYASFAVSHVNPPNVSAKFMAIWLPISCRSGNGMYAVWRQGVVSRINGLDSRDILWYSTR